VSRWMPLVAALVVAGCSSSEKPTRHAAAAKPSRAKYVTGLRDVERQLGCGIAEGVSEAPDEQDLDRLFRRMANAYAKASRRLQKLRPPSDAVAPNANLAKTLSGVADLLRVGPAGLTDPEGNLSPQTIADQMLPPAAQKALDQLKARGYPSDFEPANCDDADLLSPSTKA
jgi:hypothetical protein